MSVADTINKGARYKFGVTVQSKGFSEAPDVILRALQRLIWAKHVAVEHSNAFIRALDPRYGGERAVVSDSGDFNELLALGYMEQDKINVSVLISLLPFCFLNCSLADMFNTSTMMTANASLVLWSRLSLWAHLRPCVSGPNAAPNSSSPRNKHKERLVTRRYSRSL